MIHFGYDEVLVFHACKLLCCCGSVLAGYRGLQGKAPSSYCLVSTSMPSCPALTPGRGKVSYTRMLHCIMYVSFVTCICIMIPILQPFCTPFILVVIIVQYCGRQPWDVVHSGGVPLKRFCPWFAREHESLGKITNS